MKNNAGFTLLELLIALTLTTLIATLVLAGLRLSFNSWETIEAHNQKLSETRAMQHFIQRRLTEPEHQMVMSETAGTMVQAFHGTENSVLFPGFIRTRHSYDSEISWIRISFIHDSENQLQLRLQTAPFQEDSAISWQQIQETFQESEIPGYLHPLPQFERIRFEYLDAAQSNSPEWLPRWQDQFQLPRLIKIHFESIDSTSEWQPLTIIPREYSYAIRTGN